MLSNFVNLGGSINSHYVLITKWNFYVHTFDLPVMLWHTEHKHESSDCFFFPLTIDRLLLLLNLVNAILFLMESKKKKEYKSADSWENVVCLSTVSVKTTVTQNRFGRLDKYIKYNFNTIFANLMVCLRRTRAAAKWAAGIARCNCRERHSGEKQRREPAYFHILLWIKGLFRPK